MKRGFTLIELMIVFAIIGIIAAVVVPVVFGGATLSQSNDLQYGINGMTESRCINGYKFVVGERGRTQQILNEKGGGIPCQQ